MSQATDPRPGGRPDHTARGAHRGYNAHCARQHVPHPAGAPPRALGARSSSSSASRTVHRRPPRTHSAASRFARISFRVSVRVLGNVSSPHAAAAGAAKIPTAFPYRTHSQLTPAWCKFVGAEPAGSPEQQLPLSRSSHSSPRARSYCHRAGPEACPPPSVICRRGRDFLVHDE